MEAKEQIENLERDVKRLKANQVKFSWQSLYTDAQTGCCYYNAIDKMFPWRENLEWVWRPRSSCGT